MQHSGLVLGLAATFAGMTMLLIAVAAAFQSLVVAVVALPIAAATYFFWYQASGRLQADARARARRREDVYAARDPRDSWDPREAREASETPGGSRGQFEGSPGGFGATADAGRTDGGPPPGFGSGPGAGRSGRSGRRRRGRARARADPDEPTRAEAYAALDLEPGAEEAEIKRAYREKVKEVHPDRGGDQEAFQTVTRAYDRLT